MKKNMGSTDRFIRIFIAIAVGALYYSDIITGPIAYVLLSFSAIFVITSFSSFCPLYTLFSMNTCKIKK
ncbi:DUF2892 domain-containing protein [Maribacter sp. ACAM166]|uniref:YgaP family membrane protein n=1 Tax=Maribacter sp. ACAM166 TaxID=2508996 RepID=UPI0010FE9FE1|nr:DUF2892 domain-containing protein [Maribacter sp. ACAM166]TLP71896.1 DUF2892 domain-containing protein [Maribacter sp. ACAM166]